MPPVSPARTMATYSGPNTLGWRSNASDRGRPASTSLRAPTSVLISSLFLVCSSSTYSARRMVMPEPTIVASWRVRTATSWALIRCRMSRLISREECLSAMSSTISPRALSWSATDCLDSASTSPPALAPARSIALKTYVLIAWRGPSSGQWRGAEQAPQLVGSGGAGLGPLLADLALAHQRGQRRVHRLHPDAHAGLHGRGDLEGLALANQVAHRWGGHQDLARHRASGTVGGGHQLLGHHALQGDRQLHAHLSLLVGGQHVDHAVDGLRRVLGVQGGEYQVPGLGRGQRRRDRLQIAHLADQDHVGVLAQRRLERRGEAGRVGT